MYVLFLIHVRWLLLWLRRSCSVPVFSEILGAFISVISIWVVTGALVYLAIERIVRNDYDINGRVMLVTSGCAVVVNIM